MTRIGEPTRRTGAGALALLALIGIGTAQHGHADVPAFSSPVRSAIAGSEPGIDVAPDGTIFVNAPAGLGVQSGLSRSTDGGATFRRIQFPAPYNRLPGGGDSDVAVGPDGHVYFLDLWAGSNSVIASDDNGETWTRGTPFTTLPLTDRQWIAIGSLQPDGRDTVYVAYQLIQAPSALTLARSRDGGLTWDHHTFPAGTTDSLPGQIVTDGDFVAISYVPQGTGQLWVARSFDAGVTWTTSRADIDADVNQGIFSAAGVALDGDDLWLSYVNRYTYRIMAVHSPDRGATWEPPIGISDAGPTGMFPWIAARDGKVALAWYGATGSGDPNSLPASNEWKVFYSERIGGAAFTPAAPATGVVKRGPICTRGLGCSGDRQLGDFLQLAIDGNGRSLIAYVGVSPPFIGTLVSRQL